jgi:hypothetical protein
VCWCILISEHKFPKYPAPLNSNFGKNLTLFQNLWRTGQSANNKSCSTNYKEIFASFLAVFLIEGSKAVFKRKMEIKFPRGPLISGIAALSLLPLGALGGHSSHEVQSTGLKTPVNQSN